MSPCPILTLPEAGVPESGAGPGLHPSPQCTLVSLARQPPSEWPAPALLPHLSSTGSSQASPLLYSLISHLKCIQEAASVWGDSCMALWHSAPSPGPLRPRSSGSSQPYSH